VSSKTPIRSGDQRNLALKRFVHNCQNRDRQRR
jgi:hypothetical protein